MRPPRVLDRLIRALLPGELGRALAGDLAEEYATRIEEGRSKAGATVWYVRQVLASVPHMVAIRKERSRGSRAQRRRAGPADLASQDLRYALRGLAARPAFTAVALATLGLGIGANAAMFSVVNGVVLKPLPYEDPDRLVRVWPDWLFPFELESALAFKELARSYEDVSAFARRLFTLDGEGEPEIVRGAAVLANHFAMLGATPALGRAFLPEEGLEGAAPVALLSHALWTRRFGSDPAILDRSVLVSGVPHTVIGVMAADHQPLESDWQIWVPVQVGPQALARGSGMAVNGRLAAGVTIADAQAESRRLYADHQATQGAATTPEQLAGLRVVSLHDWLLGDVAFRLLVLLGAVTFVLLIASVNVANLLLALGGSRRRELAIRQALGAGRGRIARQLLTEALVLGLLGGALGLALARATLSLGVSAVPAGLPRAHEIGLDGTVLAFTLLVSVLAAGLFGVAPAVRATGRAVATTLRDGAGATGGSSRARLNHGLVSAEVALAVVLVAGAGLMLRSLWELSSVDPGFEPEGVLTLRVSPPAGLREPASVLAFHRQVTEAIGGLAGVEAVGAIQFLPMRPGGWWSRYRTPERPLGDADPPAVAMRVVTPDYFSTMGIPLHAGRYLGHEDDEGSPRVVLVNQTLAREAWPGEEPVGREILIGADDPRPFRVAGVVGDVRQSDLLSPPHPEAYVSIAQHGWTSMFYAVRLDRDPGAASAAVRAAIWAVDDRAPISSVSPLAEVVGETTSGARFFTSLLSAFGALALILGSVGVYGVMSYAVSQQRREIGIRMAMGAASSRVLSRTLSRGMVPVGLGLVLGVVAASASGRLLRSALYGVSPGDPFTLAVVTVVLGGTALLALYLPARRASRIDPMTVLRNE